MPLTIGPASRPPVAASAWVDSRSLSTTAIAYCGASSGANPIIQACTRSGLSTSPSSAVPVFAVAGLPFEVVGVAEFCDPRRKRRKDTRATNFAAEQATDREIQVTNDLCLNSNSILTPEQSVRGVNLPEVGTVTRRLSVC